jgi:uncharacterized repeat protein (TIGR03803 family)
LVDHWADTSRKMGHNICYDNSVIFRLGFALLTVTPGFVFPTTLPAAQIFYQDAFERPANRVNKPPSTDMGPSNQLATLVGTPVVAGSFDRLTNQCLLLQGSGFHGMFFEVGRGAPDYSLSFDFETHNLKGSTASFCLSFWQNAFFLEGDGLFRSSSENVGRFIGWTDDEPHHLLLSVNLTNLTWTLQLDDKPPNTGSILDYGDDLVSIGIELFNGDGNAQIAVDNVQIGTTADLFPLHTLRWFHGADGTQPHSRLVNGGMDDFYGTTEGVYGYPSTVFKIRTDGKLDWAYHFSAEDGDAPMAGVTIGRDNCLYGTTSQGGKYGLGTGFKMTRNGELIWSVSFNGKNGSHPHAELVQGFDAGLYGTTFDGGPHDSGTVFRLSPASGEIQTLHSFSGNDGANPLGRLALVGVDVLYGTTSTGGLFDGGTVFRINRFGALTTLVSFESTNGISPRAGLTQGDDKSFYGTTAYGGTYGQGTIFRVSEHGRFMSLYSFAGGEDGTVPEAKLLLAKDGWLYGVTSLGGIANSSSYGTIFRISANGLYQKLTSLHGGDGSFPGGGLVEVGRGRFYGTTQGGYYSQGNIIFFPVNRPKLIISSPKTNTKSTNALISVLGRARGAPVVTNVFCKVNDTAWTEATTTNSWTNWTASIVLSPGKNLFSAYAVNALGDASWTNKLTLFASPQ